MRTFVVADVHGNLDALASLLRQEGILNDEWERVDHETTVIQIGDLCNCVASSLADDARCLDHVEAWFDHYLVGNHEHPYFGGPAFNGFYRDPVLGHRLGLLNGIGFIKPCVAVGDVLVSHAGLAMGFRGVASDTAAAFAVEANRLWREDASHPLFSTIGRSRGGWNDVGGLLWSDWNEKKSRAFPQVVGHSVGNNIRWAKNGEWFAVCIDLGAKRPGSRLAGAWIENNQVTTAIYDPAARQAA